MTGRLNHTPELILLVGVLGAFIWSIQGKSCSSKDECRPDISCHIIPWSCNGSDYTEPTATPTANPLNSRCCVHLDTCGGEIEVAGWVNVRNSSVDLDGVPYTAEWLDTFITSGNATEPVVIKTEYVGSWSTLKQSSVDYPSQMFVAEPTNSCTVDGEPKWPEWYQVTVNVIGDDRSDETLEVESNRPKDCLCDIDWTCDGNNLCWVETQNISNFGADLSKINGGLEDKVMEFCTDNVTVVNYTASSYFALGFGPEQSEIDTFNFNTSVEGGWGPDLEDDDVWIQLHLSEDTMISGVVTQGVAVNPERRVDEFKVEYAASDLGPTTVGPDTVFKAGGRLDTKMTNYFPQPVKANSVKLLIQKPCDPYYIGLRLQLIGCPHCISDPECTEQDIGICETEEFCTYEDPTTLMPTTLMPTTDMPTTDRPTSGPITTPAAGPTTGPKPTGPEPTGPITSDAPTTVVTNSPMVTTPAEEITAAATTPSADSPTTSSVTSKPPTPQSQGSVATTADNQELVTTTAAPILTTPNIIVNKIDEVTQNLPPYEKTAVETLILNVNDTKVTTIPPENVTVNVVKAGLDVIRNVTIVANTTQNDPLQEKILKGAWNFISAVASANVFVDEDGIIKEDLLNDYLEVSSLVLDEERKKAWDEIQKDSVAGPLGIVEAVEDVAIKVSQESDSGIYIEVEKENIVGLIEGSPKEKLEMNGYVYNFSTSGSASGGTGGGGVGGGASQTPDSVTISKEAFLEATDAANLPENSSVVVVVLKFSSLEEVLADKSPQDLTDPKCGSKRLGSDVLSISVVIGDKSQSLPVKFRLGHKKPTDGEEQRCNYWVPTEENAVTGAWSSEGCVSSEKRDQSTKCTCDHMTNYAILMWLGPEPPDEEETKTLTLITTVGCLVSIAALALALGLLLYLKSSLTSERIIIHMHLMSVTLIAMILFLAGSDKTDNITVCKFITIGLHFFFMAMFSWMLVEGIHLYRQIVAVFDSEKSRLWIYFVIGWGIPIIVVGISSGIFYESYGTYELCWLSEKDNSIWAFMGPMIPTLLVNLVVLFMVSRIVMSAAKLQQEKPAFSSAKAGLRSSLLLLPILGVTWIIGYFQHYDPVLTYTFVILNACQGFFMALFHCFMSSEVNSALKQKIRKVKESSLGGASTIDSLHPKCLMNADQAPLYQLLSPLDTGVDIPYDLCE